MSRRPAGTAFVLLLASGCMVTLLALAGAATAAAAPVLEVGISHEPTTIPRTDERVTYAVTVANTARVAVGETLTCKPNRWTPATETITFTYRWLRDGTAISGATTATYVPEADDEGHSVQCQVFGADTAATATAVTPPVVIGAPPAVAPPAPLEPTNGTARPRVRGRATEGAALTCDPPAAWSGSPSWAFRWLRNGAPIVGAIGPSYTVAATDLGTVLQCRAVGTNAGGAAVAISSDKIAGTVTRPPRNEPSGNPSLAAAGNTTGPIALELRLPSGAETHPISATGRGWTCTRRQPAGGAPAGVTCTRADELMAGGAFPAVTVVTGLGPDAPDSPTAVATVTGGGSAWPASAEDTFTFAPGVPFGVAPGSFTTAVLNEAGEPETQAGGHPFSASTSFAFNTHVAPNGKSVVTDNVREIRAELPAGFVGNPQAAPARCETTEDVLEDSFTDPRCPPGSIVGSVTLELGFNEIPSTYEGLPVYAMTPERGAPAQFAFAVHGVVNYALTARLRPGDGYAISIDAAPVVKRAELFRVSFTFCGYGAITGGTGEVRVKGCRKAGEAGANPKPLLTNPTECSAAPPVTTLAVDSWGAPGAFKTYQAVSPRVTGCARVPFTPAIDLTPTSKAAEASTGLDVGITVPTDGLEAPGGISQGDLKRAVVRLPAGMAVNPGAADGLGACTAAQIGLGTDAPVRCPADSKVGTAEIETPLLAEPLGGAVYLAKQGDNPFGSLLALYLVAESSERGILVKIPGEVAADPTTGQLTATFDDNPQLPFSSLRLHFSKGDRAPLLNPPSCGAYGIESNLSPWSAADPDAPTAAETRSTTSTFRVAEGPNGGACPQGKLDPGLDAGLANPVAATTSPFVLSLHRASGTQRFKALDLTLPPGLTAYLKGVPYCPDAALASISEAEGTGRAELARPACPAASRIGTVAVGVGGGSPFYVRTGKAYLAGPYKGAPLSIAVVAPAVAGPFDLGTVVVRAAAFVDPETAQITVKSDPIPTILHGIPLDVRDIRVSVDRPHFTLAPTNCEAMSVGAAVAGERSGSASPSSRFQVTGCRALRFRPRLKLRVLGKTNRNAKPRLKAVLTARPGEANIRRAQVNLPHSEFLEQNHIKTVCTRVQWAKGNGNGSECPKGSIYGRAKAWTPLLDHPLEGFVYLRSNGGERKLPDLVAGLNGQVNVALWGKVDSGGNKGIRNTFEVVPDAPVSRFVLEMNGGRRGLLVNSENLCKAKKSKRRAIVRLVGHNGKVRQWKPLVHNQCGKHRRARQRRRHHKARHRASTRRSPRHTSAPAPPRRRSGERNG